MRDRRADAHVPVVTRAPREDRRRATRFDPALWVKRTATVTGTVLLMAAAVWVLARAHLALTVTVASLLVAVALNRPVHWLERHRVPRGLAIAAVTLTVLAVIAGVLMLLVPPAVHQVSQLVENGPALIARVRQSAPYEFLERHFGVDQVVNRLQQRGPSMARELVDPALAVVTTVLGGIAGAATILFLVVFMLVSGRQLLWAILARARPSNRPRYAAVLREVYRSIGGSIAGLLLLVLVNATFAGIFLAILGIPYFLPLAVLSGLASLIPYVGALFAGTLLSVVAWTNNGVWAGVGTAIYYIAYQQFENHVIGPLVYRRTVDLNPLVILVTVLFLTELAGIPGALVAVPLAAGFKIVLREILRARREHLGLPPTQPGPELMRAPARAGEEAH